MEWAIEYRKDSNLLKIFCNAIGFQIVWFACAFTVNETFPFNLIWIIFATLVYIAQHIFFSNDRSSELGLIFKVATLGWVVDTLLIQNQLIYFAGAYQGYLNGTQPFWMTCLWLSLGASLNQSLGWLKKIGPWVSLVGTLTGTLSYYAGQRLGVLHFTTLNAVVITSLCWGVSLPLLTLLSVDSCVQTKNQH